MPAPGIRLGVDFGTSNTAAVVRWPDGRARALLFDGSPLLPSAVYAEPSGALVVGRDAIHSARLEPARFEPNPKRRIDDGAVLLGDREIPVVELIAAVLARVGEEWRRTVGDVAPEVSLTCPAAWGATRRLVLADAAAAAGLGRPRLIAEPVAAATYFAHVLGRTVPIGSVVVVHDFGAGTFDASVVARTSAGFEVLAVDGRDDIGGLDVDEVIIGHIERLCRQQGPAAWQRLRQPSTVDERRAGRLLRDDVRVAKERLSRQPAADITVPLLNVDIHLTREELEDLARPILEQTVRVTQGVMRWARLPEGRVAGVFLVGGSSRIPLMATLLHRALGEPPVAIDSPEMVVAEGSLFADSAALPVGAGPAPGPHTGVLPALRLLPDGSIESARPTSGAPVAAAATPAVAAAAGPLPGSSPPVSGPPVSAPPVTGRPISGAPAGSTGAPPAYAVGRVVVPGRQPPGPPGAVARPIAATRPLPPLDRPAPTNRPHPPPPPAPDHQPTYLPARRSAALRVLRIVLLALLLLAVPLISGYISYQLTRGAALWPVQFG